MVKAKRTEMSRFETLAKKYRAIHRAIKAHEEAHAKAFDVYKGLKDELEGILGSLKIEARKGMEPGETKVLFEDPDLSIVACAPECPITYDYETAVQTWPESVLEKVLVHYLDTKKTNEFVLSGKIPLKDVEKARRVGPPPTVRVTVKAS